MGPALRQGVNNIGCSVHRTDTDRRSSVDVVARRVRCRLDSSVLIEGGALLGESLFIELDPIAVDIDDSREQAVPVLDDRI